MTVYRAPGSRRVASDESPAGMSARELFFRWKSTVENSLRQRRTASRSRQATVTFIFARRHALAASRNAVDARFPRISALRSPRASSKIARSKFRRAYATPAITQRRNFPPPLITPAHRPASRNRARCYATCATTRRQRSRIRGAIDLAARGLMRRVHA